MDKLKLIKLLYLSERKALISWGRPITFDRYRSLPYGPVLSSTLDKINYPSLSEKTSYWHSVISECHGTIVSLVNPKKHPPTNYLSQAEENVLDEIWAEYGDKTGGELIDLTHKLPEWRDPGGSSFPITIKDILIHEGFSSDDIEDIEDTIEEENEVFNLHGE